MIANVLSRTVMVVLRRIGFERLGTRIGLDRLAQRTEVRPNTVTILRRIVYWFVFLLVPTVDALRLTVVNSILNELIVHSPNVFVAGLLLFLGTLAASFVADIVRGATAAAGVGQPHLFAAIAGCAIIAFAGLIALEQLQIAPALLNILFTAVAEHRPSAQADAGDASP